MSSKPQTGKLPAALPIVLALLITVAAARPSLTAPPGNPRQDGAWSKLEPAVRAGHGAIYDPTGDRMIIVCGSDGVLHADAWALSFASGLWSRVTAEGALTPRAGALTAYDPPRKRVLIYGGGTAAGSLGDLWELSLTSGKWGALAPQGPSPGPRSQGAFVYDPVGDRMLLFGGSDLGPASDVWELSLGRSPTWRRIEFATGPSAAGPCLGVHDPVRQRLIVQKDLTTWSLALQAGSSWQVLSTLTEVYEPIDGGTLTYDSVSDRLLLCGGRGLVREVRVLSLASSATWMRLSTQGTAPLLVNHSAIFDPTRNHLVTFGSSSLPNYTSALSLGGSPTWSTISSRAGANPHERRDHLAVYDSRRNRMLMWGGSPDGTVYELLMDDVNAGWRIVPTSNQGPLFYNAAAVYDAQRDRVLVFGGTEEDAFGPVWELALGGSQTWTKLAPNPAFPFPRQCCASVILDPVKDRMIVFGGTVGGRATDTWVLELSPTLRWSLLETVGSPSPRLSAPAIYDPVGRRMLLFGGHTGSSWDTGLNDTWSLNLDGPPAWTLLSPAGVLPPTQVQCAAVYDAVRQRMVVTGEISFDADRMGTWALSLKGALEWRELQPLGGPVAARYGHVAVYDPSHDRQVVFGGREPGLGDTWFLDWSPQSPPGQTAASAIGAGEKPAGNGSTSSGKGLRLAFDRAPAGSSIEMRFGLPEDGPASLELIDLSGRRVSRLQLGSLGAGEHRASFSTRTPPGIYFVRLTQGAMSVTRRVAVLSSR